MSDVIAIDVTLSPSVSSVDVVVYDVGSTASIALVSDAPPINAIPGALWWDSTGTGLYVNYDDSTSVQWVSAQNPYTLGDAPNDANTYGRHAGAWTNLAGGAGIGGPFLPTSGGTVTGTIGFNGTAAIAKPNVTGAWAGNTAGKALCVALAAYGLITDSTSA